MQQHLPNELAIFEREAYLTEVSRQLCARLSLLAVDEEVSELRSHIDATAAAFEELGMEPSAAMRAALTKFGEAERIGSTLALANRTSPTRPLVGPVVSYVLVLASQFALGIVLTIGMEAAMVAGHRVSVVNWAGDAMSAAPVALVTSLYTVCSRRLRPLMAGLIWTGFWNALFSFSFYPLYADSGSPGPINLVYVSIGLTVILFALAYVGSWLIRSLRHDSLSGSTGSGRPLAG